MATLREHLTASKILTLHLVGSAPLQGSITQARNIAREGEKYATYQMTKILYAPSCLHHTYTTSDDASNHSANLPLECSLLGHRQREKADR